MFLSRVSNLDSSHFFPAYVVVGEYDGGRRRRYEPPAKVLLHLSFVRVAGVWDVLVPANVLHVRNSLYEVPVT